MKILAFAVSDHRESINKIFVTSTSKYYKEDEVNLIDLKDYDMPSFSSESKPTSEIITSVEQWIKQVDAADLIIISFAEYNGNYAPIYKNILDSIARISDRKPYQDKHVFLLSASQNSSQRMLDIAAANIESDGAIVIETFFLPEFEKNFEEGKGIITPLYRSQLEAKVRKTKREMNKILEQK